MRDGFFSIVQDRSNPNLLLVRSRKREHLETHFPGRDIDETPERDYRFRLTEDRETVAAWMAESVKALAYPNFKDNIPDVEYRWAATQIWQEMKNIQEESSQS